MDRAEEERLKALEAKVASLEARLERLDAHPGERSSTQVPATAAVRPAPTAPLPPAAPPAERPSLEERLGANWLPKAGILVLVLGVVFFFKFAFDAGWIGLQARIVLGVVGGLALAVLGDVLLVRKRFGHVYPQILTGGGAVIVYFSIFAAYTFEEYRNAFGISLESDAILLGVVALGIAAYAAWRDTPTLAAEAGALVATTALFAEAWTSFAVGYLVVATALLLAAGAYRAWKYTPLLMVLPGYLLLFVFFFQDVDPWIVVLGAGGLLAAFIVSGLATRVAGDALLANQVAHPAAAVLTWALVLLVLQDTGNLSWAGWVTLGGALLLAGLAFAPHRVKGLRPGWGVAAMLLALFWPPIEFDGIATVYAWSGLTALAVAATVWRRTTWSDAGLGAAVLLMGGHLTLEELPRLSDERLTFAAGLAVFGVATFVTVAAWLAERSKESGSMPLTRSLLGVAVVLPILFFGAGLDGYGISIAWTLEAVLLVALGLTVGIVDLRYASFGVFGLVLARVFLVDIAELEPVYRVVTFLVVGALLLVVSFFFARRKRVVPAEANRPEPGAHGQR